MENKAPTSFVRFGWETFKKRPGFLVGVTLIIAVVSGFASSLGGDIEKAQGAALVFGLIALFVGIVVQVFIKMGSIAIALKANDDIASAALGDLWAPEMFWQYFLASIAVGLMVVAGFILLIIPGVYIALRFMFVPYLVVDRRMKVGAALKESSRMTEGRKWQLLGLVLLLVLINIAGALLLLVGLLVTMPVTTIALAHAYRTLEHAVNEVVPVA
jgi:uncharacterized membrane protein